MPVSKVSSVDELFPALRHIGTSKNFLPTKLRGWVNILGLYVQTGLVGSREYLAAGGKYKRYFYAICEYTLNGDKDSEIMASTVTGDFSRWKVKRFDQTVWEKRFAHLVEPTCEIAWYLGDRIHTDESGSVRVEKFEPEQSLPKLMDTVNRFNSTGEWLGLYHNQCASCGQSVSWWNYFCCKLCPHCGGKIRD
ncbi:MAG: hypothetical protein GH159_01060 [Dehalococcoidia bacterium]|nr:hypothetical protein [Dehalococcoidia bacterium]